MKRRIDIAAELSLHPLPFLALLAIAIPAFFLIWMQFTPAILTVLQRDPQALLQGQWWRLFSPLLVDSDGWLQFVTVSIGFLCVGISAQHWLGWWRWLLLFFAGATAGEIMGYLWQPYGGGTSIALFGLIGGMVIFLLRRRQPLLFLTCLFALFEVVALVGSAHWSSMAFSWPIRGVRGADSALSHKRGWFAGTGLVSEWYLLTWGSHLADSA